VTSQLLESCSEKIWTKKEINVAVVFPDVGYSTLQVEATWSSGKSVLFYTASHGQRTVMSMQWI